MSGSDRARRLARWWAASRLVLGGVAVLRPDALGRVLGAPDPDAPVQQFVVRNVGSRDIALAVPLVLSLRRRGRPRVWIATAMLVDALDLAAVLMDWPNLPKWQRRMVASSAAGSVAVGAALVGVIRTRREDAEQAA